MTVDITDEPQGTAMVDTRTGRELWRTDDVAIGAAFAPDGSVIAIADELGDVLLLDAATGDRLATLPTQPPVPEEAQRYAELEIIAPVEAVLAFDPEGSTLAVAGPDGPVWLWDVDERALASDEPLLGHGRVSAMSFSPDGEILATGGPDEQIRLWDVADADLTGLTSQRPQGRVYDLLFSPDGRTLVSLSAKRELWDVGSRQRIGMPMDIGDPSSEMAFSGDGDELIVVGSRGDVTRVDTSVESWIEKACAIANRDLSTDEIRQFLDGRTATSCAS
jgi:WD40 repeat protein